MPEHGVNAVYKAARAVLALEAFRFDIAHAVLGCRPLNVGTIRGGLNFKSVPDAATISIDIRTIPDQKHAALHDRPAEDLGVDVALTVVSNAEGVRTDADHPWVQQVFDVTERIAGVPRSLLRNQAASSTAVRSSVTR